jgi:hypothetical protein
MVKGKRRTVYQVFICIYKCFYLFRGTRVILNQKQSNKGVYMFYLFYFINIYVYFILNKYININIFVYLNIISECLNVFKIHPIIYTLKVCIDIYKEYIRMYIMIK